MSDSKTAMKKTMVVLIPIEFSSEVKQFLVDKEIYDNNFRPKKYSQQLALPVKGNSSEIYEQLSQLIPRFATQLSLDEYLLESNSLKLSPGKLMESKISAWLDDNEFLEQRKLLVHEIPQKWELLGDLALLPSSAFTHKEWTDILMQCNDSQINQLWTIICQSLNVNRLGRQQPISNNEMRTSQVELLFGTGGWVELIDYGVYFGFDATKVMFSSGNVTERHRIGNINMENEIVVDAFAGIGYYTLPILVRSKAKHVHACEINPNSIEALIWGAKKNNVLDKITIHEGDNKVTLTTLEECADRCHLGILPSSQDVWNLALKCLKPEGGWLHIHMNVSEQEIDSWTEEAILTLQNKAEKMGRKWHIDAVHIEKVKWYAPYIRHIVLDVYCSSINH